MNDQRRVDADRMLGSVAWAAVAASCSLVGGYAMSLAAPPVGEALDQALGFPLGKGGGGWIMSSTGYLSWLSFLGAVVLGVVGGAVLPRLLRRRQARPGRAFLGLAVGIGAGIALTFLAEAELFFFVTPPVVAGLAAELEFPSAR